MKHSDEVIRVNIKSNLYGTRQERIEARDALLQKMGVHSNNTPLMVTTETETVINPFFVSKMHSQHGFPKEMVFEEIEKRNDINPKKYWSDWCDFWFDSFTKIPHTILCDSKAYYEAMNW